ncbi:MAG TPA: hypothetical protein VFB33_01845 [Candidatus Binataceae bacterium]|jgi:hypothetical protein|nr:hypothetical protein [Candidatus Binataceae bacterium]
MDQRILQKWTDYTDEVSKRMSPTEEREDVAPLVAAILTLADEIFCARGARSVVIGRRQRTAAARGETESAQERDEPRGV